MQAMTGGYWAVLPAAVRHDRSLTQTAKLLYAEVSSLAQADGYCWATDKYFAELLSCSESTVSRALRTLSQAGYIRIERSSNAAGTERHIYAGLDPAAGGSRQNEGTREGTVKNDGRGPVKNDGTPPPTQYDRNKKKGENAPAPAREGAVPKAALDVLTDFAADDTELREALVHFGETKRWKKKPEYAAKLLVKKLRELSGGDRAVMLAMLDKATERGWESVFPLKEDELPKTVPRGTVEAADVADWTPGVMS